MNSGLQTGEVCVRILLLGCDCHNQRDINAINKGFGLGRLSPPMFFPHTPCSHASSTPAGAPYPKPVNKAQDALPKIR